MRLVNLNSVSILVLGLLCQTGSDSYAQLWRQYADPTQAGFSSEKLEEARKYADKAGSTAVVAIHKGHVLAAWGEVERPCEIHSVRKSIFSGLFGILVAAGKIDLNTTLAQLGIDDQPPLTEAEKQARVVDLLRARSGVYHTAAKEPSSMKSSRPERGSHAPGEFFWYNNWDFNTLGPILEKATGRTVAEELYERIVSPLGMEDFQPHHAAEQLEPSYSIHAAYDIHISARDLARFGMLFSRGGNWNGRPVIPESWVKESMSMHTTLPDGDGYGYMWWIHPKGKMREDSGYYHLNQYDKFSARGSDGQFLLIIPEIDFVFAHTTDTINNRKTVGPKIWRTAELILAARTGEQDATPLLVDLRPIRFSNPPPPYLERKSISLDRDQINRCVGEYAVEGKMHVRVFEFKGRLFANLRGVGESELFAESETKFFVRSDGASIEFARDAAEAMTAVKFEMNGQSNVLPRIK